MPHIVLSGSLDFKAVAVQVTPAVVRWGRAVLKTESCWLHHGQQSMLIEGVVVEYSRPLHPVALVAPRRSDTIIRLWSLVSVERTAAVQRWLALVARDLQQWGAGPLRSTNIPSDVWVDLGLVEAARG